MMMVVIVMIVLWPKGIRWRCCGGADMQGMIVVVLVSAVVMNAYGGGGDGDDIAAGRDNLAMVV